MFECWNGGLEGLGGLESLERKDIHVLSIPFCLYSCLVNVRRFFALAALAF